MMKYLLFSDIHGCLPALQRALDFFESQKCDMMCILGDIINYGPRNRIPEGIDPKGIVERLNNLADKIIAVRGNCDAEVDQMLLDFPRSVFRIPRFWFNPRRSSEQLIHPPCFMAAARRR